MNIVFTVKSKGDQGPVHLTQELERTLKEVHRSGRMEGVIAYTDGSTEVRSKSKNSGCGILITDGDHVPIWKGGLSIRADGNNFIPEIAAASILIKACPENFSLVVNMDSKAAIGALSKGRSLNADVFMLLEDRG